MRESKEGHLGRWTPREGGPWGEDCALESQPAGDTATPEVLREGQQNVLWLLPAARPLIFQQHLPGDQSSRKPRTSQSGKQQQVWERGWSVTQALATPGRKEFLHASDCLMCPIGTRASEGRGPSSGPEDRNDGRESSCAC